MRKILFALTIFASAAFGAQAQYASDAATASTRDEDWLHRGYRGSLSIGGGPQFVHHGSTFISVHTRARVFN